MSEANTVRGEVELRLGEKTYVLVPEEGRAVRLDDALPRGILGTLLQLTDERVIKVRTLAKVIKHLAQDAPDEDTLAKEILGEPLMTVSAKVARVLSNVAGGGGGASGKAEAARSGPTTESTGAAG